MAYSFRLRGKTHRCGTLADCSAAYSAVRDALGLGASRLGSVALLQDGVPIGHISYNGRIWPGTQEEWQSGLVPLFDNRIS